MRESELLAHIEARSRGLEGAGAIAVGPGDDCAVIAPAGPTLATVDQLIAGRHFDPASTTIDQIARKAVARSVSDIAAMGGTPTWGLATGCLPFGYPRADELFDRMAHWATHWGCPLAGGDIAFADGPMVLTVSVFGVPHASRGPVLRRGARPGDLLYVTGELGGSLRSGRHLMFEPRVRVGAWLCDTLGDSLHAMIDISDGLGRDAGRIGKSSGVRIEFDAERLPLAEGVREWREGMSDGEDYELLFAASPNAFVPAVCPLTGARLTWIGRVIAGDGAFVLSPGGGLHRADDVGWDHG